jgi:PPM family protein phosphatase
MPLILRYAVRSDLGLVRTNNEDSVYAGPRLLAIADGMGGHAAGEVASKIVIGALEGLDEDRPVADLMGMLRTAVLDANRRIAEAVAKTKALEGMGTTLTALRFSGRQVGLVHVGDSRGYVMRGDQLSQITHDDTYVQHLVDAGKLTPDEAKEHPRKSVILRALLGTEVEPDVSIREARAGDRYLLCTDGLSDVVTAQTMLETLRIADPQESADRLVELALRGGGPDNVTVIVADVLESRRNDHVDDLPVIAGAFVDPSAADVSGADSAAERAARMSRPPAGDRPGDSNKAVGRHRWPWRTALVAAAVVAVLIGALAIGYRATQSYYFVGRDGTEVAIFRGVNTQFGPLKFFNVFKNTDIAITDLQPAVRDQVQAGINAHNEGDAQKIVTRLQDQLLPICRAVPPPTPTATPPRTPVRSSPNPSPTPATARASAPRRPVRTTPKASPRPTPSQSPVPAPVPEPGVNCREV